MKIGPEEVHSWPWLIKSAMYARRTQTDAEIRADLAARGYSPEVVELVMKQVTKEAR